MNLLELIWLSILQGITELFPISSLGHSILVPDLLHWSIDREAQWYLPFLVALHLSTATALFIYFWRDWFNLLSQFMKDKGRPASPESRLLWLLIVGTIPAGLLGLALEHFIRKIFAGFEIAAIFLTLNGIILIAGDRLKSKVSTHTLSTMRWPTAIAIGCAQALALIPGISRSGITLICGLGAGLDYASSARFSFLLATPIIGAAGLLEMPKLLKQHLGDQIPLQSVLICAAFSGVFAYLSTVILMRYFKHHEVSALRPFGIYCILAGVGAFLWHVYGP